MRTVLDDEVVGYPPSLEVPHAVPPETEQVSVTAVGKSSVDVSALRTGHVHAMGVRQSDGTAGRYVRVVLCLRAAVETPHGSPPGSVEVRFDRRRRTVARCQVGCPARTDLPLVKVPAEQAEVVHVGVVNLPVPYQVKALLPQGQRHAVHAPALHIAVREVVVAQQEPVCERPAHLSGAVLAHERGHRRGGAAHFDVRAQLALHPADSVVDAARRLQVGVGVTRQRRALEVLRYVEDHRTGGLPGYGVVRPVAGRSVPHVRRIRRGAAARERAEHRVDPPNTHVRRRDAVRVQFAGRSDDV